MTAKSVQKRNEELDKIIQNGAAALDASKDYLQKVEDAKYEKFKLQYEYLQEQKEDAEKFIQALIACEKGPGRVEFNVSVYTEADPNRPTAILERTISHAKFAPNRGTIFNFAAIWKTEATTELNEWASRREHVPYKNRYDQEKREAAKKIAGS